MASEKSLNLKKKQLMKLEIKFLIQKQLFYLLIKD